MKQEIVVVGGGLIGMLSARELALAGHSVRLLERGETGRESSWAGGGILSPLYPWRFPDSVTALAGWSQRRYPDLCRELEARTGIDPQWRRTGLLILHSDEFAAAGEWAGRHGIEAELLEGSDAIRACEPVLGDTGGAALWMPQVAHVRNPRLLQAVRRDLEALGGVITEHLPVTGLLVAGGRVCGVDTAAGRIESGAVVVAGGAWTGELLAPLGLKLPVRPVRGQMLLYQAEPTLLSRTVLSRDRYVIPRRDGRILVGSTVEEVGFDKGTTAEALAELRREAARLVPALEGLAPERQWAGLRPGSPEGVPYIGALPGVEGLFVNAGHFRNGVVLGLASARLLADLVGGREPALDPAPYRPGRDLAG